MDYSEIKTAIQNIYGKNDGRSRAYKERLCELEKIFLAQVSSLNQIRESGFFEKLSDSFWDAIEVFLDLAQLARNENRFFELIRDSYIFIKSFDNALQGYLNSDRLFLEFPGHSVSLYDLPAKLGVVYVQYITAIINSLKSEEDPSVAFLLCPEPFEEEGIHVMRLLYGGPGKKEMLVIEAPRTLMFEPDSFLFALAHEIAHYVDRSHRLLEGNDKPRNIMLYKLHEEEYIEKCKEGLDQALADEYNKKTAVELSDNFEKSISAEDSTIRKNIKREIDPPSKSATFSEMELYLFDNYTNPLLRNAEIKICEALTLSHVSPHNLSVTEQTSFMNRVRIRMAEYLVSGLIEASSAALYITKEGAADAAAIKLLKMNREDYINKIMAEHSRIVGNDNLKAYLLMRASLVCSACFGKKFDLMHKRDKTGALLVLPYEQTKFANGKFAWFYYAIGENSDKLLIEYIKSVHKAVKANTVLAKLYSNSKASALKPHSLFSDYLL